MYMVTSYYKIVKSTTHSYFILEYDPNAVIKTRNDECSEANEHEHSPHCEEEHPECDFLSKYRFVFFQSLPSKLIWGMSMILLI